MSHNLRPDGTPVTIAGVKVSAWGISGLVNVRRPDTPESRGQEEARPQLRDALERGALVVQLTIEIAEPAEQSEYLAPRRERGGDPARGEGRAPACPEITVQVPGPGTGLVQVILACDEDGLLSWHLPVDVPPEQAAVRGGEERTYRLRTRVAPSSGAPGASRGLIAALGKKLLKVLVFKAANLVLGEVGKFFVSRYEREHSWYRLRRFTSANYRLADVPALTPAGLDQLFSCRVLMFIHGTASRSHRAFAMLPPDFVAELERLYEGHILAFDHPTLSVDPLANVAWLADEIQGVTSRHDLDLDIVAHSRGGLVGRVICETPADADLNPSRVHVHDFVMVATPNAGTPLADARRLGAFVDVLTNLFQFSPDNPATNTIEIVLELVKQVAIGVTGGLDGLMAMDPNHPFLRHLNESPALATTTYHALAADYEPPRGSPLGRYFRDLCADRIFPGSNDLVVPTEGVFAVNGAGTFPVNDRLVFAAADAVDHSGFWSNARARAALENWLGHVMPVHA